MTDSIQNKPAITTKGYVQVNAGVIKNAAEEAYSYLGATLGGEVNYKNTYLRGEAGAGTALTGKLEIGHEFDIGKNMGLDLSAKGQYSRNNFESSLYMGVGSGMNMNINGVSYPVENVQTANANWKAGETRLGAQAELTFKSKHAKFGVGLEGGLRHSTSPNISMNFAGTQSTLTIENEGKEPTTITSKTNDFSVKRDLNKKAGYITPTLSAEIQLGKKSNFSFVANADMYQGQAGIRYTF